MTTNKPYGEVHHFNFEYTDEDGDPMFGYYWRIIDHNAASSGLMGPYSTYLEAATACEAAWRSSHHG